MTTLMRPTLKINKTMILLIFKISRNNLSDHVYLFLVILLIIEVGRNNLSGHVYIFHVVTTCYTSTFGVGGGGGIDAFLM